MRSLESDLAVSLRRWSWWTIWRRRSLRRRSQVKVEEKELVVKLKEKKLEVIAKEKELEEE